MDPSKTNFQNEIKEITTSEIIKRYPLNGRSNYLIDKFYIIGYDYCSIKKHLYDDSELEDIKKQIKTLDEEKTKSKFIPFYLDDPPYLLNEFSSDYEKEGLDFDMIKDMIIPNKLYFYYSENDYTPKSPAKFKRKAQSKSGIPFDFSEKDLSNNFDIYEKDPKEKNGINFPESYNVIFSSNPQSGNNSKKSINGFAYVFYKKLKKEKIFLNKIYNFYIPKIFCVISEYPFFNSFYKLCKQIESLFKSNSVRVPLEIIINNIINFTKSPLNGNVILSLQSFNNIQIEGNTNQKKNVIKEEDETERINILENESNLENVHRHKKVESDLYFSSEEQFNSHQRTRRTVIFRKEEKEKKIELLSSKTIRDGYDEKKNNNNSNNITTKTSKDDNEIFENLPKIKFHLLPGYPLIQYNLAKVLLQTISPSDVINIFMYTFLEKDVIFFSKNLEYLSLTINSYLNLNFPLNDEKYYFINASVSFDNYINGDSAFVGSTFTTIIGINDVYKPKYINNNSGKLKDHISVDLDNGKVYMIEDKNNKEGSKKDRELFGFIKQICKNKDPKDDKTRDSILFREIVLLNEVLTELYNKMNEDDFFIRTIKNGKYIDYFEDSSEDNNNYNNFVDFKNIKDIKGVNLAIQGSFYRFISDLSLYFYQNLSIKTEGDNAISNKNRKKSKTEKNIGEDDMNVIFREDEENYIKEEGYLLEELKDTMKFESFVYGFVQSYNPIDLYKIPLTFTEEFISIINRKSSILNKQINFLSLFDVLYKRDIEDDTLINFENFLNDYYTNYKKYIDREIEDISDSNIINKDRIKVKLFDLLSNKNKKIIKYHGYELDDKILKNYLHILNNLTEKDLIDIFSYDKIKKNILKEISVTDIESLIENYAMDNCLLTQDDLCCANIIILFTLSLRSFKQDYEWSTFLAMLFQDFTVFRKYYSMIMSMIYILYNRSVENQNYELAQKYFYTYYLCINSFRSVKLVPNESLMNIIKKFNKINIEAIQSKTKLEQNSDNKNTPINGNIKLYGINLPEDEITKKNVYVCRNFTFTRCYQEEEIVQKINSPFNNNIYVITVADNESLQPKIKFYNGIHKIDSFFYSQKLLLSSLVLEYKKYINDLNGNNLSLKIILDACLNILVFMRNSKFFNDKNDIIDTVKIIFYIFMNQFLLTDDNKKI